MIQKYESLDAASGVSNGIADREYMLRPDEQEVSDKTRELVAREFENASVEIQEALGGEERKLLGLLHEKDPITFEHSMGVAEISLQEYEEFKKDLFAEGITEQTYLRACALHDIGKLALPDSVLKGKKTWDDMKKQFDAAISGELEFAEERLREQGILQSGQHMEDVAPEIKLDFRDLLSLRQLFADEPDSIQECERYGLNVDSMSFLDAIKIHQERSRQIIQSMHIPDKDIVADIAGSHHRYETHEDEQFPGAKEVLRVTEVAAELLHLNDVYHAITQDRPYQKKMTVIQALHFIYEDTIKGEFRKDITKRWMRRAYEMLDESDTEDLTQDMKLRDDIINFIAVS